MKFSGNSIKNKIIFLSIFGIAMGFMEAVVVVYLRQLYYPEGFSFPLKIMALEGLSIEYFREISTIVMLFSIAMIAGKNFYDRFSYFLFSFGIWDIFYYVWLKILLNWPHSFLTWDILFLIPVVWAGPVLAPLICASNMVMISSSILIIQQKGELITIKLFEWIILYAGAFIIFLSFIWEYSKLIIQGGFIYNIFTLSTNHDFQKIIENYIPTSFNWILFIIGECLILGFIFLLWKRMKLRS